MTTWWTRMLRNAEGGTSAPATETAGGQPGGTGTPDAGAAPAGDSAAATKPADGTGWYDSLPEAVRNDPSLAKFAGKPLEEFASAHRDLAKFVGVPADDILRLSALKEAGLDGLLKLGAGDKPEAFTFKPPEGVPEHLTTGENLKWFQELAAEARLLPAQAEKLYEKFVGRNVELQKAADETVAKATQALKEKHGPAFEKLTKDAGKGADQLGLREVLSQAGLAAHPAVIEAMAKVAAFYSEGAAPDQAMQSTGPLTPAQAEGRAIDLTNQALQAWQKGDKVTAARLEAEALAIRRRGG